MGKAATLFFFAVVLTQTKASSQLHLRPLVDSAAQPFSLRVLPQNFYTQQLSFFCKKEVQLQKLTSLPLFIRLGSKDYVDYLEKKPNAAWLPKQ
jgi:hypothetical protein